MGLLSSRLAAKGGLVHGVKLAPFLRYEASGQLPSYGQQELVDDLHTQKKRVVELSDAFLVLPGAFGTLDGIVTMHMWRKLGRSMMLNRQCAWVTAMRPRRRH
jgi:predicted Rossmann-fold nucleotide-binding protein